MRAVHALVLAWLPAALCCGGSGPASPSITALSELSGRWDGTLTITQVGGCAWVGGPMVVSQDWTVTDAGQLTFPEPPFLATWSGTITSDLKVTATRREINTCAGSSNTFSTAYSGVILRDGSYRVNLEGTGTPCPPCNFKYVYSLTKR